MAEDSSPRQMASDLLQGIAPPRPLFLPIIFSLGARVENLPLPAFLNNPTKISNAQRQIHGRLPADGVTCYFDPYLEVEALGAALRWQSDDQPPSVCWPAPARKGELPQGLRSPQDAVKAGRIGIAAEVIRRLNSVLRDGTLLMAGLSGPFTLAARLAQMSEEEIASPEDLSSSALDLAAATLTQVASAFVEVGTQVIIIHEKILPRLSAESCDAWASLLSPTFNIIRFYGALPVLLLGSPGAVAQNVETLASRDWEGILCPVLHASSRKSMSAMDKTKFGVALPLESLSSQESTGEFTCTMKLHPALITTAGDIPVSTDIKRLAAIFNEVRLSQ